jgi:GNAT superfamily N-acetyltransferase
MMIRRAEPTDLPAIEALVRDVVLTTYNFVTFRDGDDWSRSWIAELGGRLAGVVTTTSDRVDALWIGVTDRRRGIGVALLDRAEREIAERGHSVGRLRCVYSNANAIAFYEARGWTRVRRYPDRTLEFYDLEKRLSSGA